MFEKFLPAVILCGCFLVASAATAQEAEFGLADMRAKLSTLDDIVWGDKAVCGALKRDIEQTDKFSVVAPTVSLTAYDPAITGKYTKSCPRTDLSVAPGYNSSGHHESLLDRRAHGAFKLYQLTLDGSGKTAILVFARTYMTDQAWTDFGSAQDFPANVPAFLYPLDSYAILNPNGCQVYLTDGASTVGVGGVTVDRSGVFKSGAVNYLIDADTKQGIEAVLVDKVAYDKYLGAEPKPVCAFQKKQTVESAGAPDRG